MPRASNVRQAAFLQFASYDRNVWEDAKGVLPDFADMYVERPAPEGVGVLLALAAALAEHVLTWEYDDLEGRGLGKGEFGAVIKWLEPLQTLSRTPAPPDEQPWTVKMSLYLAEITRQLKTDEPIRAAVLQDPSFAPSRLERLASDLVRLIERGTKPALTERLLQDLKGA